MRTFASTLLLSLACCATPVEFVDRHDGGAKKSEGALLGSVQEGTWTYFWENGNVKAKGEYRDDIQVGPWTWWYENGNKQTEGAFYREHSVGLWKYWHPNGKPHMVGWFDAGQKTGEWTVFDGDGRRLERGQYSGGKRTSRWVFSYPDGRVKAEGWFLDDAMIGPWRFFDDAGQVSTNRYPVPAGVEIVYEQWSEGESPGGPRRAGFLVGGVRTGRWVTWHESGELRIAGDFVDGMPLGIWCAQEPTGTMLGTGPVRRGRPSGRWQVNRAGSLQVTDIDSAGRPPGEWSGVWSKDGDLIAAPRMVAFGRWLLEVASPCRAADLAIAEAAGGEPSSELREAVATKPKEPVPRAILTRRDIRRLATWLKAYTDGISDAIEGYGPRAGRDGPDAAGGLVGKTVDPKRFKTPEGRTIELDQDGRWTLLVVLRGFAGQVCPYCGAQLKALAKVRAELEQLRVRVVAVYPGPKSGVDAFLAAYKDTYDANDPPPYDILYDVESRLAQELGILDESLESKILARPTTLILDPKAEIRYAYVGQKVRDRPAAKTLIEKIREIRQE